MGDAKSKTKRFSQALCRTALAMAIGMCLPVTSAIAQGTEATVTYSIPAGDLAGALDKFSTQSGIQLLYKPELVAGKRGRDVSGAQSPAAALKQLLEGTGLTWERANATTYVLKPAPASPPPAPRPARQVSAPQEQVTNLPEILVTGTRSLNTDIERTRDDVQPYVVFDREMIERSGAVSVDDFLKQRLPMNATARSFNQGLSYEGNRSQIDLRGLGTGQTLILIDGRRTSNTVLTGDTLRQADLNGIPLSAIERIEVLPTTASGIYGGDATGGVINVILRRDYQGGQVKLTFDDTFDTDSAQPRIDLNTGFNIGERTNLMVSASRSWGNVLMNRDRDFVERYRRQAFANNPNLYLPPASAPLGAVPNLRSADGSNLVLDDGTPLGSNFTHVASGYAGANSDGGAALLANAGTYDFRLANSSQADGGGREALLNAPEVTSGMVTLRHEFTPKIEGFLDLTASNNVGHYVSSSLGIGEVTLPADAPNNPFRQDIQVRVPMPTHDSAVNSRNTDRRVTGGVIVKLPGEWLAEVDYVWSQSRSRFAEEVHYELTPEGMAALQDGTLDILSDSNAFPLELSPYLIRPGTVLGPFETTTRSPTVLLGGAVGRLPGGEPRLSLRLEHREEDFAEATLVFPTSAATTSTLVLPAKSQTVSSVFAGLTVPLFSSLNARRGLQELDVELSVRHDRYTVEGATNALSSPTDPITRIDSKLRSTNFTAGLRWKPVEDLMLRASFGTGFLPPNVNQLVPERPIAFPGDFGFVDPHRGNTPLGEFQYLTGGNPDLKPEESESLSAGLILTPRFLPGLRLSVDYTRIEKEDNISNIPGFFQGLLDNEALFPGRVMRGANLPGDPAGWAGPVTFMDLTLLNLARTEVEAYDVQLDYAWNSAAWGSFNFFAVATWQTHYKTQLMEGLPIVENVGFNGSLSGSSPLKLKGNVGVSWEHHDWSVSWLSRYFDAYRPYRPDSSAGTIASNLQTQGATKVNDQLYHDLMVQYDFSGGGWLGRFGEGLSVQFGVRNVFNKTPPRDGQSYSLYGDPRLTSYWLMLSKSFSY